MTGFRASLAGLAADLVAVLRTRAELFGLELAEEKSRLLTLLGMVFGALFFLSLAVLVFSLLIAALYWPTEHRYLALAVLAGVYALIGIALLLAVRRRLVHGPAPFAATVEELRRDADLLAQARQAADAPPDAAAAGRSVQERRP